MAKWQNELKTKPKLKDITVQLKSPSVAEFILWIHLQSKIRGHGLLGNLDSSFSLLIGRGYKLLGYS